MFTSRTQEIMTLQNIIENCKELVGDLKKGCMNADASNFETKTTEFSSKINIIENQLVKYINKFYETEGKWRTLQHILNNINCLEEKSCVVKVIKSELTKLFDIDYCAIAICEEEGENFAINCEEDDKYKEENDYLQTFIKLNNFKLISTKLSTPDIIKIINNNLNEHYYAAPLIHTKKFIGIIFLYKKDKKIHKDSIEMLNFAAGSLAMSIANSQLYLQLLEQNESRLEFISNLSHEMKNPLNSVINFSELMFENQDMNPEKRKRFSKHIYTSSKHLNVMMDDVLDITKMEYDKFELYKENFNPSKVIQEITDIIKDWSSCEEIDFEIKTDEKEIYADVKRFRNLIYNLVTNAIKYSESDGKIKIHAFTKFNKFFFIIKDTGEGIHPKHQNKLFKFLSQADDNIIKRKRGSGIGLSYCKKITDAHKGQIGFKSIYKKGSTFWFSLPAVPEI